MYGGVAQVLHLLVPAGLDQRVGGGLPARSPSRCCSAAATRASRSWRSSRSASFHCSPSAPRPCCCVGPARSPAADLARGLSFEPAGGGTRHRDRGLRDHRRRRDRAGAVPVLVRREGLRALRRPARRHRGVGRPRPRLDPRHAPRHPLLAGDLHPGHGGVLSPRRRRAPRRAASFRRSGDTIQVLSRHLHADLGDWALWLFYAGAVITLYGTIFASTAAHSRLFADAVRVGGGYERADTAGAGSGGATCSCWCWRCCRRSSTGSSNRRCRWCSPAAWPRRHAAADRDRRDLPAPPPRAGRHPARDVDDGDVVDRDER